MSVFSWKCLGSERTDSPIYLAALSRGLYVQPEGAVTTRPLLHTACIRSIKTFPTDTTCVITFLVESIRSYLRLQVVNTTSRTLVTRCLCGLALPFGLGIINSRGLWTAYDSNCDDFIKLSSCDDCAVASAVLPIVITCTRTPRHQSPRILMSRDPKSIQRVDFESYKNSFHDHKNSRKIFLFVLPVYTAESEASTCRNPRD